MKMKKLISGLSAMAIAASVAGMAVSADEAPVENQFYNATGNWVITYSGSTIKENLEGNAEFNKNEKPEVEETVPLTLRDTEELPDTYTLGMNFQTGHLKNGLVTIKVTSTEDNIWDGEKGTNEGYMYTVQSSWNGDASADFVDGWVKYNYNEDGTKATAKGAADLNAWKSGGKFNGNWAQITLTNENIDSLTFEVTVKADEKTKWEYHPYNEKKPEDVNYVVFNGLGANGAFVPSSVTGDGTCTNVGGQIVVDMDYINKQIEPQPVEPEPVQPKYTSIKKAKVKVTGKAVYTGKALKPAITVTLNGKTLKNNTDYKAAYKNSKKPGKATVTVTGKGNYIDSVSKNFVVVPKKQAKPTVKAGKAKMTVTVKKDKLATGYQISYSLKKNFKSGVKSVNIGKKTVVKKTIKKLKGGKTYYVKSRSYIKVGKTKYYGPYSAVKAAKIKK